MRPVQPTVEDYAFWARCTPVLLAQRVALLRSMVKRRVLSLVVSGAIAGFLWWRLDEVSTTWAVVLLGSVGFSAAMLLATTLRLWRGNRMLNGIEDRPALRIDPLGVIVFEPTGPIRIRWEQVDQVGARAHLDLPGPELVVRRRLPSQPRPTRAERRAAEYRVPFLYLDVLPGTIDSAVRAHTGGRMSLDLSRLDRII